MKLRDYLKEAKKITVKDLPSMFHKDPLYKAVLMAKNRKEYDKALETLKSIRGDTAFKNFVEALKDAQETFDKARKKHGVSEATIIGDYTIPTYGLTGVLKQAHLEYFTTIIKKFGTLSKVDQVFQLRKAWTEIMQIISDEKTHNLITKKMVRG